ncbi:MAG: hypothetical protein ABIP75_05970 [Pyrinomonadaceae bacterium]
MKKFTALVLKLSLVLSGLMIITNNVNATKGDVETALSLIKQARAAIGGDDALRQIQSLSFKGQSTRTFQMEGQSDRQMNGEFEIALMQPDRMFRMEKLGNDHEGGEVSVSAERMQKMDRIIRVEAPERITTDGVSTRDAHIRHNDNDYARYMIALLLTAPESAQVKYDYAGDGDVDGAKADVIVVLGQDDTVMKLYLDKSSHLPLMMTHQGYDLPPMIAFHGHDEAGAGGEERNVIISKVPSGDGAGDGQIIVRRGDATPGEGGDGKVMIFKHDGEIAENGAGSSTAFRVALPAPKEVEIQTRFSDYRPEGGILLPHRLSQTVNGKAGEVLTINSYAINSPATAERFAPGNIQFTRRRHEQ